MALIEVGRFPHPEAHILIGRLEAEGIPAIAFDAGTNIAEGGISFLIPVRVMVDDSDYAAARKIVENAA